MADSISAISDASVPQESSTATLQEEIDKVAIGSLSSAMVTQLFTQSALSSPLQEILNES